MSKRIYLSPPHMNGCEMDYVNDAFDTNWVAPYGPNLKGFEDDVSDYIGINRSVALSSGTAAIHLALLSIGVKKDDVVFCSDFTFAGSCNPAVYIGAKLVFIDSDYESLNMSPVALEKAFEKYNSIGKLPKAVIIVDLYGSPANYDALLPICEKYGVTVIEDAAEALGAEYKGRKCGTFGKIGILSFNGNKIITTSGGGMACSDDAEVIDKIYFWANQAKEPANYYLHKELGYNYRMSNVCAGIGRGQMKTLDDWVAARKANFDYYKKAFADLPVSFVGVTEGGKSNCWLTTLIIDKACNVTPDQVIDALESENIESRRVWNPMHCQPIFENCDYFTGNDHDVGVDIFNRGVCMPSGSAMTQEDLDRVTRAFRKVFGK